MQIIVKAKSPFGVLDASSEKWYNPAKKEALKDFVVGGVYDITLGDVKGKNGKVYKSIVAYKELSTEEANAETPKAEKPVTKGVADKKTEYKPKRTGETSEKVDWAAKDRSQLVGGRSHDAAVLTEVAITTATPLEDVLKLYKEALEGILKIATEVK